MGHNSNGLSSLHSLGEIDLNNEVKWIDKILSGILNTHGCIESSNVYEAIFPVIYGFGVNDGKILTVEAFLG